MLKVFYYEFPGSWFPEYGPTNWCITMGLVFLKMPPKSLIHLSSSSKMIEVKIKTNIIYVSTTFKRDIMRVALPTKKSSMFYHPASFVLTSP